MSLWEEVKFAMKELAPPPADATPERITRYRWANYLAILVIYAAVTFHVLWICGAFNSYGLGGAAFAADLAPINSQINFLLRTQLEGALLNDELTVCRLQRAAAAPNADLYSLQFALDSAQKALNADLYQYRTTIKEAGFTLQPCTVILIVGGSKP